MDLSPNSLNLLMYFFLFNLSTKVQNKERSAYCSTVHKPFTSGLCLHYSIFILSHYSLFSGETVHVRNTLSSQESRAEAKKHFSLKLCLGGDPLKTR